MRRFLLSSLHISDLCVPTSVPKLQVTPAALPAGEDANQILILAVEFADRLLFVTIYVLDGGA